MKEEDIRPFSLFDQYLKLAQEDCKSFFNSEAKIDFNCPIHPEIRGSSIFSKNGFNYRKCSKCESVYVSPRHKLEDYELFYLKGKSVEFWSKEFYKETEKVRKEKLWKPKVRELIRNPLLQKEFHNYSVIDIGGGFGIFAETIVNKNPKSVIVIEPNKKLADICRRKGIKVIEKFFCDIEINDIPKSSKIFTSFELLEHLYNPREFLLKVKNLMNKGDILYMTTLTSSGLDIKTLGKNSNAVTPPHHINFLSVNGINEFLKKEGFEEVEITTPGKLDFDIIKKNKKLLKESFLLDLINKFSEESIEKLQILLAENKMSSHMLINARL